MIGKAHEYTSDEINSVIQKKAQMPKPKYSLFDQIILLLYADKDYPIYGKTLFMKEIFLAQHEVFQIQEIAPVVFIKYHFGPYNAAVENIVDDMLFSNYIDISKTGKPANDIAVTLTTKGLSYAANLFDHLSSDRQSVLKQKRKEWDTHTDILNYVYTYYDKYLENAKLKKRYAPIDWEKDETEDSQQDKTQQKNDTKSKFSLSEDKEEEDSHK